MTFTARWSTDLAALFELPGPLHDIFVGLALGLTESGVSVVSARQLARFARCSRAAAAAAVVELERLGRVRRVLPAAGSRGPVYVVGAEAVEKRLATDALVAADREIVGLLFAARDDQDPDTRAPRRLWRALLRARREFAAIAARCESASDDLERAERCGTGPSAALPEVLLRP